MSRSPQPAEGNYAITERESLAVIWCLRKPHCCRRCQFSASDGPLRPSVWLFEFDGLMEYSIDSLPNSKFVAIQCRGQEFCQRRPLVCPPLAICNVATAFTSAFISFSLSYKMRWCPILTEVLESFAPFFLTPEFHRSALNRRHNTVPTTRRRLRQVPYLGCYSAKEPIALLQASTKAWVIMLC